MKLITTSDFDAIIIGSGMGGMSAAAMHAKDGLRVLVLEAAHAPGGCSSSYYRKGYTFETGATTLIGFDEHQPLRMLEAETGIEIPRKELNPPMQVYLNEKTLTRYKNREKWIAEAGRFFGNPSAQRRFWEKALALSDIVWKASSGNPFFPPQNMGDWFRLIRSNSPTDAWILPYAFKSVQEVMKQTGVDTPEFVRFVNEQLMITAQSKSGDTPFIFGAPGLTYTNYSNFYVPGGLINMVKAIQHYVEERGGELHTKEAVNHIEKKEGLFSVQTKKQRYTAPVVVSNIPVWNMPSLFEAEISSYFQKEAEKYQRAWGAITLGIATSDTYPEDMPLHHQLHLDEEESVPFTPSGSVFVSMSQKGDTARAPEGQRVLNVSCHAEPDTWYALNGGYYSAKKTTEEFILRVMEKKLPGFSRSAIQTVHTSTPITWENWVYRKKGRVGGIPQSMARSLLDWTSNKTPLEGLYLCGDTTYPGQGIPGVTLSGINVYYRIKQHLKKRFSFG